MIYFDYNATAPLHKNVIKKIQSLKFEEFGNPSSVHKIGRNSKKVVEEVRRNILSILKAKNYDLIFTSGATESNNLAIKGFIKKNNIKTIYSLETEHASVIDVVKSLEIEKKFFKTNSNGTVNLKEIEEVLSKQTTPFLVSIMFANNESGIIHPINEIAKIVKKYKGIIHCDGVQSLGKIEIDLDSLDVDLFSISSHKIGGPTGIGALLINTRNNITPEIIGGGQEKNLRSGTENFLGILGFGEAMNEVKSLTKICNSEIKNNRDLLETNLKKLSNEIKIFGEDADRLANTCYFAYPSMTSENQVIALDQKGICVSSGAACSSGKVEPSHVLKAMKVDDKYIHSAIRVSLGWDSTKEQVETFFNVWKSDCFKNGALNVR
ncbi:MAG: cysteine desulfurase [Proteobacteria bacterium]|uniref:Cysteine desulfurase n=1 Tax=Candidatus Fonsibacter lacus TaxID=2576439 RepID=A0A964UYU1_9PROT|nr:cysteine desulfurase [Candidatus Fonsibacter lacus]NBP60280.1 cysteine desulfurase [Pseudomonadota bacterium]